MNLLSIILVLHSFSDSSYDLTISVPNLKSGRGEIQIGVYNTKKTFPDTDGQYKVLFVEVEPGFNQYVIRDLPEGEYAVALFHDENADRICNRNFFGIPTEGYGFSNNVKPVISAPAFDACKFNLSKNMEIEIRLLY